MALGSFKVTTKKLTQISPDRFRGQHSDLKDLQFASEDLWLDP